MQGMSKTREALEAARTFVGEGRAAAIIYGPLVDGKPADTARYDALLAQIDAALDWQPRDAGPWAVDDCSIVSHDFNHDAILRIDGDFADADQKALYAQMIVDRLNRSYTQIDAALAETLQPAIATDCNRLQPGMVTAEYHQRAVAEARRQALEDAEEACVITRGKNHASAASYKSSVKSYVQACDDCEDAIRALQDQAPQPAEPTEAQIERPMLPSDGALEDRIKTLMQQAGVPNSMSIYAAFKQFSNELLHEMVRYGKECAAFEAKVREQMMAERKPLTDEQMAKVREEWARKNGYDPAHGSFRAGFRAAERAHGITQENEQ